MDEERAKLIREQLKAGLKPISNEELRQLIRELHPGLVEEPGEDNNWSIVILVLRSTIYHKAF